VLLRIVPPNESVAGRRCYPVGAPVTDTVILATGLMGRCHGVGVGGYEIEAARDLEELPPNRAAIAKPLLALSSADQPPGRPEQIHPLICAHAQRPLWRLSTRDPGQRSNRGSWT